MMHEGLFIAVTVVIVFLLAEWYSKNKDNNDDRF